MKKSLQSRLHLIAKLFIINEKLAQTKLRNEYFCLAIHFSGKANPKEKGFGLG
jgi:hypothetical protein